MGAQAPRTVALAIRGPLDRSDLTGLYGRVCQFLHANGPAIVVCDVGGIAADAIAVEALARLQLGARRSGCVVRLHNASEGLREIVALLGLSDVLPEG